MWDNERFVHLFRKAVPSLKKSLGMSVRSWRASAISRREGECERWFGLEGAVRSFEGAGSGLPASEDTRGCDGISWKCECDFRDFRDDLVLMLFVVIAQFD
jgi:hypothetical protein